MSSRVLGPGQDDIVSPINWRSAKPGGRPESFDRQLSQSADSPQTSDLDAQMRRALEEAFQRGYNEGVNAAKSEAGQAVNRLAENVSRAISSLAEYRPRLRKEAEGDLVKLSVAIARRILKREMAVDPDSIHALVKVALEKLQGKEGCKARIHPDLYKPVKDCLERLTPSQAVEVAADASLEPGGIMFETSHGDLDASIESQLREIERGFADRLGL